MPIKPNKLTAALKDREERGDWLDVNGNVPDDSLDAGYTPFWQFRISIKPTRENVIKATQVLTQLSQFSSDPHPEFKIFIPNKHNDLTTWDATLRGGDRDQRGKEICITMAYQAGKNKPAYYEGKYPSPTYLKKLMLDSWVALQKAGVEMAYITPGSGEKEITCQDGSITPFFYSSYKPYRNRNEIIHSNDYNPTKQTDPLANVQFTSNDLASRGIHPLTRLTSAKRLAYQLEHYDSGMGKILSLFGGDTVSIAPNETYIKFLSILNESKEDNKDQLIKQVTDLVQLYKKHEVNLFEKNDKIKSPLETLIRLLAQTPHNIDDINHHMANIRLAIEDEKKLIVQDLKEVHPHLAGLDAPLKEAFDRNPDAMQLIYERFVHFNHEREAIGREKIRYQTFPSPTFPKSYTKIAPSHSISSARELLNDYTKSNSWLNLAAHLHLNRHHVAEVAKIVKKIDKDEIKDIKTLIENLNKIPLKNPRGSLSRRMELIIGRQADELLAAHASNSAKAGFKSFKGSVQKIREEHIEEDSSLSTTRKQT